MNIEPGMIIAAAEDGEGLGCASGEYEACGGEKRGEFMLLVDPMTGLGKEKG
jgi:hypothetical protein